MPIVEGILLLYAVLSVWTIAIFSIHIIYITKIPSITFAAMKGIIGNYKKIMITQINNLSINKYHLISKNQCII